MADGKGGPETVTTMSPVSKARQLMVLLLLADQVSKGWALQVLDEPVDGPGPIALVVVRNSGAAFGSLPCLAPVLAVVGSAVLLWCWWAIATTGRDRTLALSLLGSGAGGNAFDRLFRAPGVGRGAVVDFVAVADFPVFNLADVMVCSAVLLLLLRNARTPRRWY